MTGLEPVAEKRVGSSPTTDTMRYQTSFISNLALREFVAEVLKKQTNQSTVTGRQR